MLHLLMFTQRAQGKRTSTKKAKFKAKKQLVSLKNITYVCNLFCTLSSIMVWWMNVASVGNKPALCSFSLFSVFCTLYWLYRKWVQYTKVNEVQLIRIGTNHAQLHKIKRKNFIEHNYHDKNLQNAIRIFALDCVWIYKENGVYTYMNVWFVFFSIIIIINIIHFLFFASVFHHVICSLCSTNVVAV